MDEAAVGFDGVAGASAAVHDDALLARAAHHDGVLGGARAADDEGAVDALGQSDHVAGLEVARDGVEGGGIGHVDRVRLHRVARHGAGGGGQAEHLVHGTIRIDGVQLDLVGGGGAQVEDAAGEVGRDLPSVDDVGLDAVERQGVAPGFVARLAVAHRDGSVVVVVAGNRQLDAEGGEGRPV